MSDRQDQIAELKKQQAELERSHERHEINDRDYKRTMNKLAFRLAQLTETMGQGNERGRSNENAPQPDFFLD